MSASSSGPRPAAAIPTGRGLTRAIGRNAAWLLAGRLAAQALGIALTLVLARRLGVAGFGAYAFVSSAVFLANVVTTFGTDMVLIRDIAAGRPSRWGAALAVQLGLSCGAMVAAWLLAPLAGRLVPAVVTPLRIFSLSLAPAAFFSVCSAVLRGMGRMGTYAALGVAASAIQLAAIAALAYSAPALSLEAVFVALLGVQIAVAALAWAACAARSESMRMWPRISGPDVRAMLRSTGTIGVLGLLGMTYQRIPILLLAAVSGPAAAGWFAGASKVIEASKTGHVALFGAIYPAMARARGPEAIADANEGAAGVDPGLRWSWRVATGGAVLISAGLVLAGPVLVRALYGSGFAPSGPGLVILALSLVPSTLATYQSLDLVAGGRETATVGAQLVSLAALLVLIGVLVPALGWMGGCWAVLAAEVVQAAAFFAVRRSGTGIRRVAFGRAAVTGGAR